MVDNEETPLAVHEPTPLAIPRTPIEELRELTALRICRFCNLKAHTEEDLKPFVRDRHSIHGRQNLCRKCSRENSREYRFRTAEFIKIFRARPTGLQCHFCEEPVTKLSGQFSDSLAIHSLDGNHENWDPLNKGPTHKYCHNRHHNPRGEGSSNWQGDVVSNHAKYMRGWRRKRRDAND